MKRGGLVQRHQGKGESVHEAKGGVASRPAREEGGGAERVDWFSGAQGDRCTEAGRDRSLPGVPWSPHSSPASFGLAGCFQVDICRVNAPSTVGQKRARAVKVGETKYRGTSLIRDSPPPLDRHRSLGIFLL